MVFTIWQATSGNGVQTNSLTGHFTSVIQNTQFEAMRGNTLSAEDCPTRLLFGPKFLGLYLG
jgi:hypothetical protein